MSSNNPIWQNMDPDGRMLRPSEVAKLTGLSRSQIYAMIAAGHFPPFIKLSERTSALPETWLKAFIRSRARNVVSLNDHNADR